MHIETLATSHNRCEKTLSCLRSLHKLDLPAGVTINHNLVDDGSTDGTSRKVSIEFPKVNIINGNGLLFWAGGMRYGWENCIKNKKFDYLFVFNDDCVFFRTALKSLLVNELQEKRFHIIVGAFESFNSKSNITYGGRVRKNSWHPLFTKILTPNKEFQKVDTLNMNGALIHISLLKKVGFLSDAFIHSQADFEYGLKVKKSGGDIFLCPGIIGKCEANSKSGTSLEKGLPLLKRYARLLSNKEQPISQSIFLYREHGGIGWPILIILPFLKILFYWVSDFLKNIICFGSDNEI